MNPYVLSIRDKGYDWIMDDLLVLLHTGTVVSTNDYFVMARMVNSEAHIDHILHTGYTFPAEEIDCWHIHWYSGNLMSYMRSPVIPKHLPKVSWVRHDRYHKLDINTIPYIRHGQKETNHRTGTSSGSKTRRN